MGVSTCPAPIAGAVLAALAATAAPALAQTCSWDGTSTTPPPGAVHLRSDRVTFGSPGRIAVDAAGNTYTSDPATGRVVVRDSAGRLVSVEGSLGTPLAIAVSEGREILVGDLESGSVGIFDADWNLLDRLGAGDGEFLLPNDLAIDPDPRFGAIYVSDGLAHAVKVYSPSGDFLFSFGGKGTDAGRFDFPAGVWVDAAGEVFVADQNNDRVQVFDRQGNFLRCFGSSSTASSKKFGRVLGITGDAEGRLYVADAFQGEVLVFDADGVALAAIGRFGEADGELRNPMGLAIDPFNRLFVTSPAGSRVEIFGLDGFTDPHLVAATVEVRPASVTRRIRRGLILVDIELADGTAALVDRRSVTANGVYAETRPWAVGDRDGDGIPELMLAFDARALLRTLTDGDAIVDVEGDLVNGGFFEGAGTMHVVVPGNPSAPGDPPPRPHRRERRPPR